MSVVVIVIFLLVLLFDIYLHLFIGFRLLHNSVVVHILLLQACIGSAISCNVFFFFIPEIVTLDPGLLETASLSPRGSGKAYTRPSPDPTCGISLGMLLLLWQFEKYLIRILLVDLAPQENCTQILMGDLKNIEVARSYLGLKQ